MDLNKEQKKALIKKYKQEESDREFAGIKSLMSLEQLEMLIEFVDDEVAEHDCDETFKYTVLWLEEHGFTQIEEILAELEELGGYCDCEVVSNIEVP